MASRTLSALIFLLTGAALSACGAPVFDRQIDGPYRLRATDSEQERMVCYGLDLDSCVERIPAFVVAVGSNANFVVAERHPLKADGFRATGADEYFYIDRKVDGPYVDPSVSVHGPFDLAAYGAEQARLGLPPLRKIDHIRNPWP
jgi:hypothetical protein